MSSLPPNAPSSPPFSAFTKDELVAMLHRAEAKILYLEREHSTAGGIWTWEGDPAGLKQETKGARSTHLWSKGPENVQKTTRPPPRLPNELLRTIASHCDDNSLINLCLTNLLFLEIASPILYETMVVLDSYELEAFVGATYSPSLSALLPRVSLGSVLHLQLPVQETEAELYTDSDAFNSDGSYVGDDDDDASSNAYQDPLPILPFSSLLSVQLNILPARRSTNELLFDNCIDLLATLNPSTVTFHNAPSFGYVVPWDSFDIIGSFWNRCLTRWSNLTLLRFSNVLISAGRVPLHERDPWIARRDTPKEDGYTEKELALKYEWDVTEEAEGFAKLVRLILDVGKMQRAVEMPWNRRDGRFRILVGSQKHFETAVLKGKTLMKEGFRDVVEVVLVASK